MNFIRNSWIAAKFYKLEEILYRPPHNLGKSNEELEEIFHRNKINGRFWMICLAFVSEKTLSGSYQERDIPMLFLGLVLTMLYFTLCRSYIWIWNIVILLTTSFHGLFSYSIEKYPIVHFLSTVTLPAQSFYLIRNLKFYVLTAISQRGLANDFA